MASGGESNDWELCKENIQPLKHGRRATALNESVSGLSLNTSAGGSTISEHQKQIIDRKKSVLSLTSSIIDSYLILTSFILLVPLKKTYDQLLNQTILWTPGINTSYGLNRRFQLAEKDVSFGLFWKNALLNSRTKKNTTWIKDFSTFGTNMQVTFQQFESNKSSRYFIL